MKTIHRSLVIGCSMLALSACGPEDIVSPQGGDIIINNPPAPAPTPTPTATGPVLVTPAAGCPTISDPQGLTDSGTITGPTGTWRVCELPDRLLVSSTLTQIPGLLYSLGGRVDIGNDGGRLADGTDGATDSNVVLTIEPGVIMYGGTGRSYLVVNRGNRISAIGTAAKPIIFTSRDNVLGLSSNASIGQWGGVVLLGRAPVSDCRDGAFNKPNQADCEQQLEGSALTTLFGGNTPADNSGTMRYFQIRYSGFTLESGSELQSLTLGGVGSATTVDHWQSVNSSDDGMEFFGGLVNMSEVIVLGADDDAIDVDTGSKTNMKNVIVSQRTTGGDNIIELDSPDATPPNGYNSDATPQTVLQISNFTFIQRSGVSAQLIRARGGAKLNLANGVMDTDNKPCIRIDEPETRDAPPSFNSIVADCSSTPFVGGNTVTAAQVLAIWNAGAANNAAYTPTLTNLFVNGTNENGVAVFNTAPWGAFFATAPANIGASYAGNNTWYSSWTCNVAGIGEFGANTGNCTSLPVF